MDPPLDALDVFWNTQNGSLRKKFYRPARFNALARKTLHEAVILPSTYARFSPCGGGTSGVSIAIRILAKRNLIPISTVFEGSGDKTHGQVI